MIKTIIFDYDGTIHQTLGIYEPAFRETYQWLTEQKVAEEQKIASSKIAGWLGLNSKEMWDTFMPELDQKYKDQASKMVGERMIEQVRKHKAVWYPGAEKMLTTLKNQGYYLVVLSNCKTAYRKAHWEEFGMKRWFERFYDCESYGFRPKTEIVQDIIREYYSFIRKRLKNKEDLYRREVVMGLMQGFFFELCNIFNSHAPTAAATVKNKSRKEYIFERFYESLIESYQSERSVKFYADQLCLTPKHLSGVVKEVSGKTVGEWIDELVILEAKALLDSSSMNIQEIADRLNFANQSFFGKYFKHYTGMSPKEYRKSR